MSISVGRRNPLSRLGGLTQFAEGFRKPPLVAQDIPQLIMSAAAVEVAVPEVAEVAVTEAPASVVEVATTTSTFSLPADTPGVTYRIVEDPTEAAALTSSPDAHVIETPAEVEALVEAEHHLHGDSPAGRQSSN